MPRVVKVKRSDGLAGGAPISTSRASRLSWLLERPELWREAPSDTQDVSDGGRAVLHALGARMVAAGLYSHRTELTDRTWGLRVLIGEARKRLS